MRVLVDENIPRITVHELAELGHDLLDIRGTPREGMSDNRLWQLAQRKKRVLMTTDKGFLQHRGIDHSGLLVVTLRQPNRDKIHAKMLDVVWRMRTPEWPNTAVVVKDNVQSVWTSRERD